MSTFVNNDVASGAIVYASDHNTQGASIAAVLNGGIDNANIASGAAIDGSKLADSAVTSAKINFGGSGAGVWWQEIGRTTLSVAGDTISVTPFTAKKYLHIICNLIPTAGNIIGVIRFNNDSASNYSHTNSTSGAADTTATSQSSLLVAVDDAATMRTCEYFVTNILAQEKLCIGHTISSGTAGAANAPVRRELNGKWANTSAQITRVDAINSSGGDFAIGSEVIILGHD